MESTSKIEPTASSNESASKSTISFPYSDQDACIEVARGVLNGGGNSCDLEQLAAQLKMEAKGGGFRLRINAASAFGFVIYERGGRISLTKLGRQVLDQSTQRKARAESFLNVEIYKKVYDEFKGGPFPPQPALERALIRMGVSSKVADRARIVLMRSAKQAGFFDSAADRLVKPPIRDDETDDSSDEQNRGGGNGGGGGGGGGGGAGGGSGGGTDHPLISGLLLTLPAPGNAWSVEDRLNWLTMANSIFKAIYPKSGGEDTGRDVTIDMKPKESRQ